MYYLSSENKVADQLRGYREADLRLFFRLCRLLVFPRGGSFVNKVKGFVPRNDNCVNKQLYINTFSVGFSFTSLSSLFQLIRDGPISRLGKNRKTPRNTTWHTHKQSLACLAYAPCGARTHTRHSDGMIE